MTLRRVQVVDSHTGGEPTRVVIAGGPDLGMGSLSERRRIFSEQHDSFRSAVVNEPRGSDALVGALLVEPVDATCAAGVIYFDNVQTIGMCGHGTIGLAVTLGHLGRIGVGTHRLETPVGVVAFDYAGGPRVTVENVPSYRLAREVEVTLSDGSRVRGDIAWGGNWFFITEQHGQDLSLKRLVELTAYTQAIKQAIYRQGITGAEGSEIDHIVLLGKPVGDADSRNFVLCPGGAYDRSPCGTGTSAIIACRAAEGTLRPGQLWRQESIVGSIFEATYQRQGERIIPRITGSAYVNAEATLLLDPNDPFEMGIRV